MQEVTQEQKQEQEQEQETRLAVIAIIVEEAESVTAMNGLLHDYSSYIIGRMGIPYPARKISLISVAIDAPADEINALTGKLGKLLGVTVKTAFSKM